MRKLNSIQIEKNGHTAIIGGGVISKNLTDTLWKQGKQTGEYPYFGKCKVQGGETDFAK
jgi:hypothetical protein